MENKICTKCGNEGDTIKITIDDNEFASVLGVTLCDDCYDSFVECVVEMIYG